MFQIKISHDILGIIVPILMCPNNNGYTRTLLGPYLFLCSSWIRRLPAPGVCAVHIKKETRLSHPGERSHPAAAATTLPAVRRGVTQKAFPRKRVPPRDHAAVPHQGKELTRRIEGCISPSVDLRHTVDLKCAPFDFVCSLRRPRACLVRLRIG